MSRIRSSGNKPEASLARLVRKAVLAAVGNGVRTLQNARHVHGTPDVYVPRLGLAFFMDGCFFHGCPMHFRLPQSNTEYWLAKIERNQRRDRRTSRLLRLGGVSVWRLWEHELKPAAIEVARARIALAVRRAVERRL